MRGLSASLRPDRSTPVGLPKNRQLSAKVPRGARFAPLEDMVGWLSPAEIEDLLHTELVAHLGCHADGRTYVVPITYGTGSSR